MTNDQVHSPHGVSLDVLLSGFPSEFSPYHATPRVREAQRLNIEVSHTLSVGLDESFARRNFVTH